MGFKWAKWVLNKSDPDPTQVLMGQNGLNRLGF